MELQYSENDSIEKIRVDITAQVASQFKNLPEKVLNQIIEKLIPPYLSCPAEHGRRVNPLKCTFCPYGHMTDCHYPKTCEQANCSHYQRTY